MAKWADYCISRVEYNAPRSHIVKTEVRKDNVISIGTASEWSRLDIIAAIKKGTTFVTVFKDERHQWTKGQDVRIIKVKGTVYIRTDANSKEADNLDRLPEF